MITALHIRGIMEWCMRESQGKVIEVYRHKWKLQDPTDCLHDKVGERRVVDLPSRGEILVAPANICLPFGTHKEPRVFQGTLFSSSARPCIGLSM